MEAVQSEAEDNEEEWKGGVLWFGGVSTKIKYLLQPKYIEYVRSMYHITILKTKYI